MSTTTSDRAKQIVKKHLRSGLSDHIAEDTAWNIVVELEDEGLLAAGRVRADAVEEAARLLYEAMPRRDDTWYAPWVEASEGLRDEWRAYSHALQARGLLVTPTKADASAIEESVRTEVRYRLRTIAAHYRSCGKHGVDPGDMIDREISAATQRLTAMIAAEPDPTDPNAIDARQPEQREAQLEETGSGA